jgi:hypothetical protein
MRGLLFPQALFPFSGRGRFVVSSVLFLLLMPFIGNSFVVYNLSLQGGDKPAGFHPPERGHPAGGAGCG